jgi:group I intron endonuclease
MVTKDTDRAFVVYCHTNKINNKKYIGITCQEPEVRWGYNGNNYKQAQPYFARAIHKYGWDSFSHEILFEGLTAQEASDKEIELIASYNTYVGDPNCQGYNLTRGGFGGVKYLTEEDRRQAINKMSNESKKKSRDRLKQDNPEAYEVYLQKERARNRKRIADPVQYRKLLDKTNRNVAKYKQDPIKKEKILAAKRQIKSDVKQLRTDLKILYSTNKNLFTEEQRHLIFDFNIDGKNYICTSKKQLQNIKQQIYLQMEDLCLK